MTGYTVTSTWEVWKGAEVLARGRKTGTLYMTSGSSNVICLAEAEYDAS